MDKPSLNFSGRDGTLSANAFTAHDITEATAAIGATAGVRLLNNEARLAPTAQPYNLGIEKTGDTVTLTGNVPGPSVRRSILDTVKAEDPSTNVVDKLTYALGAPAGFETAAKFAVKQLPALSSASMALRDGTLTVNGVAPDRNSLASLMAALKTHPGDLALGQVNLQADAPDSMEKTASVQSTEPQAASRDTVTTPLSDGSAGQTQVAVAQSEAPLDNAGCQSLLSNITRDDTIHFEIGSTRIHTDSAKILDSVVATAQRCPTGNIEIQGYTDSEGSSKVNLALSQRRSDAVKQYLAKAGIDGSRLTAIGYGPAKPVASNDTPDGRAKNRRIEFLVK
ncbi:OmpA family protein [Phyllobacterium salinisoli]|uniref:OmpA family protein n=1 Tax=Phyllobacterium salinisoli TaxID=1899321 RepID=UPI00135C21C7|nr:OmpA family protein [Phyllobacterium salinisoli]